MNCKAEIIVEQHTDTVYVPVQAVLRVGGQPTVYVLNDNGETEERKVEIGLDDNSMVRIISGLNEGELVLLAPPLKNGAVEPGSRLAGIRGADANEVSQQITEKLKAANEPAPNARRPRGGGQGPCRRAGARSRMERLKNLPPEERQKEIERMRTADDAEKGTRAGGGHARSGTGRRAWLGRGPGRSAGRPGPGRGTREGPMSEYSDFAGSRPK